MIDQVEKAERLKQLYSDVPSLKAVIKQITTADPGRAEAEMDELNNLSRWTAKWRLLYNLPYNYLVPDGRMLPDESIRFFSIDQHWLDCLIDGAFSIGTSSSNDTQLMKALEPILTASTKLNVGGIRTGLLGNVLEFTEQNPTNVTGLLLNSKAVKGWPSMQVDGFADVAKTIPLKLLRMSCLSPNTLLCLFDGTVKTVDMHLPGEGLHFGFDALDQSGKVTFSHKMRYTSDVNGQTAGSEIPNVSVPLTFRSGSKKVVDVTALASNMLTQLTAAKAVPENWTSAEFGMEMVLGNPHVIYTPTEST
jgi:hypothetical protein